MDSNAKWITNVTYKGFKYLSDDIFHKELDKKDLFMELYHLNTDPSKPYFKTPYINAHILFRKDFFVNKDDSSDYSIHISADDYYFLYINGEFVCSGPAPGYPWHYYYNNVDISKYIKDGRNVIAVHTFYQGLINRVWVSGDWQHGMICQIFENNNVILSSDESFKCKQDTYFGVYDIAVKRHDTIFNEILDSNSLTIGFEFPDYDDTDWEFCHQREYERYKLYEQQTPMLEYYNIKPQIITKAQNTIFIDIGQEIIGYLNIDAHGNKGDKITIEYAEELDENNNLRSKLRCVCTYVDKWILSGDNDHFRPFDYKGFRYAKISLPNDSINVDDIYITVRHCEFEEKTFCPIDDPDILRIWDLCKNTIKFGVQECFIDCPTREKGQYLGDVTISSVAYSILTKDTRMLRKAIIDFGASSHICKGLMAVSTSSFMQEIADFSLLYPYILLWYYKLSGDRQLLLDIIPTLNGLIDYFKKYEREDGLVCGIKEKWNIVDWPDNLRDNYDVLIERPMNDTCHNVINSFYIGALKCTNEIYKICGYPVIDVTRNEKAFIDKFYNEQTGLFTDSATTNHSALHSNVLPLLFNIGINEENTTNIVKLIEEKKLNSCGTYFSYFVLQALKNIGEKDLVLKLIKDEKVWLNMLKEGATTTFEAWGKDQKKNTSLCHPWSTCPIIILYDM